MIASKIKHGRFTKEKRDEAKRKAKVNHKIKAEILEVEQWFITEGYIRKDWKKNFG